MVFHLPASPSLDFQSRSCGHRLALGRVGSVHMREGARLRGARGRAAHNRPFPPLPQRSRERRPGAHRAGSGGGSWPGVLPSPISLLLGWRTGASAATPRTQWGLHPRLGVRRAQDCATGVSGIWEKICRPIKRTVCHLALGVRGGRELCVTALSGVLEEGTGVIITGSVLGPACLCQICLPRSHCPVVGLADP